MRVKGAFPVRWAARDGKDGRGISSVTYEYARSAEAAAGGGSGPSIDGEWSTSIPGLTEEFPYLWCRETTVYTDGSSSVRYWLAGARGADGKGIASAEERFCVSGSGSTEPGDSEFTETSQAGLLVPGNAGKYLWRATVTVYSDSSTAVTGKSCLGEVSTFATPVAQYARGTAGEVTGEWQGSAADAGLEKGDFLWTRTRMDYAGGGSGYTDPINVGYWGTDGGSGRGVSSVTEHYLATSASGGVTADTSGWTGDVQAMTSTDRYLWNYETTVYTDGSSEDTDPHIIGVYGDTGAPGRGIQYIHEFYTALSVSSGVDTSSKWGWVRDEMPTMTSVNRYLWNYEFIIYTDGNSKTVDPRIIGVYGDSGAEGPSGIVYRTSVWESGQYYRNDSLLTGSGIRIVDVCMSKPLSLVSEGLKAYQCVTSHTSTSSIPLGTSGYWTEVTDLKVVKAALVLANKITAAYIDVDGILTRGLNVTNVAGKTIVTIQGSSDYPLQILDGSGGFLTWVDSAGKLHSKSAEIEADLTVGLLKFKANSMTGDLLACSFIYGSGSYTLPHLSQSEYMKVTAFIPTLTRTGYTLNLSVEGDGDFFVAPGNTYYSSISTKTQSVSLASGGWYEIVGFGVSSSMTAWAYTLIRSI